MKFWTIQHKNVLEHILQEDIYTPNFNYSPLAQKIPELTSLLDLLLRSYIVTNLDRVERRLEDPVMYDMQDPKSISLLESHREILPGVSGLVFGFAASAEPRRLRSIDSFSELRDHLRKNRHAAYSLLRNLITEDNVLLELEHYPRFLNPLPIDLNDYQALMPPPTMMYPYSKDTLHNILSNLMIGHFYPSPMPSHIVQVHLPYISSGHLVSSRPALHLASILEDPTYYVDEAIGPGR